MKATFMEIRDGKPMQYRPLVLTDGEMDIAKTACGEVLTPKSIDGYRTLVTIEDQYSTSDGKAMEMLTGYTDRGVDASGQLPPETRIYFNRVLRGTKDENEARFTVKSLGQILAQSSPLPERHWSKDTDSIPVIRLLRPEDILGELEYRAMEHYDHGVMNAVPLLMSTTRFDATYAEPPTYVEWVKRAVMAAEMALDYTEGERTLMGLARDGVRSPPMMASRLLTLINHSSSHNIVGYVTYAELQTALDELFVGVVALNSKAESVAETHGWDNDDPETVLCAHLEAELPSMILNRGLDGWQGTIGHDANGTSVRTRNARFIDESRSPRIVLDEVETRVRQLVERYAQMGTRMDVVINPIGESTYAITHADGSTRRYAAPTYADGTYSSFLTPKESYYDNLADGIEKLLNLSE